MPPQTHNDDVISRDINQLSELFRCFAGSSPSQIVSLKGDGSDRRIYRISEEKCSVIGVVGDQQSENEAFVYFSKHFKKHGLPVPDLFFVASNSSCYLEQDLGDQTLFDVITASEFEQSNIQALYSSVLDWLPEFQIRASRDIDFSYCYQYAEYAQANMMWDLRYFENRFLNVYLKKSYDQIRMQKELLQVVEFALQAKTDYFLYRDFQSRNIMLIAQKPHFIDYQSGRRGAVQYDVASLLYDSQVKLSNANREKLLDHYLTILQNRYHMDRKTVLPFYSTYAFLRILQALGAFGFLTHVKRKTGFASAIPLAYANLVALLEQDTFSKLLPYFKSIISQLDLQALNKVRVDDET